MMKGSKPAKEKPTPLGDRVYARHRKMIRAMKKKLDISSGEVVRRAIENEAERNGIVAQ